MAASKEAQKEVALVLATEKSRATAMGLAWGSSLARVSVIETGSVLESSLATEMAQKTVLDSA